MDKIVELYTSISLTTFNLFIFFSAVSIVGHEVIAPFGIPDAASNGIFLTDLTHTMPYDGKIKAWTFYAGRTNTLYLQVWRPQGGASFQLVGQTEVTPSSTGVHRLELTPVEMFDVKAGDTLGIGWISQGVVNFSNPPSCTGDHTFWTRGRPSVHNPGIILSFSNFGHCRTYKYNAEVVTGNG